MSFTVTNTNSKLKENFCHECELEIVKKACNSANCMVCGQYIHIVEQKKRIRNCISCFKYVHVSCDKYYGSDKLENYVCISCRDKDNNGSSFISPILDKVYIFFYDNLSFIIIYKII